MNITKRNKTRIILLCLAIILLLLVICLTIFRPFGREPYGHLDGSDIQQATLTRYPPDDTVTLTDPAQLEQLADILDDLEIYRKDSSASEYSGQLAQVSFTLRDGTIHTVGAYNPFLYVNGTSYRTEYESCEELNRFINRVLDNQAATSGLSGPAPTDTVTPDSPHPDGSGPSFSEPTAAYSNFEDYIPEGGSILEAKIIKLYDGSMLVAGCGEDASAYDLFTLGFRDIPIFLSDGTAALSDVLDTDMIIHIAFDGLIMETYPGQIGADAIQIVDREASLVDFYLEVIEDWYEEDPALNADITMIGFDFSQMQNLTETEKNALIYLVENEYNLESVTGTFDELCDAGYIDRDNLYWENGVLFEISDTPIKESILGKKTFTFSISKWRSGLGAIGSDDCKAELDGDEWEYEVGATWIS